jgi:hypothetical protein
LRTNPDFSSLRTSSTSLLERPLLDHWPPRQSANFSRARLWGGLQLRPPAVSVKLPMVEIK